MIPKAYFLPPPTIIVGLLLLSLSFVAVAEKTAAEENKEHGPTFHGLINIDDTQENLQDYMTSSDGSGEEIITDDEDQGSGTEDDVYPGSGTSIQPEVIAVTNPPSFKEKLSPCLRQHKQNKESGNIYVPHCTKKGEYHKLQCTKPACWCVDPHGVAIKGTNRSKSEEKPDCETGINLGPCLKSLLKHSTGLLGSFRPTCSESGEYKEIQCHETRCWCVDKMGQEVESTKVNLPQMPTCVVTTPIPTTTVRSTTTSTKATTTSTSTESTTTISTSTTTTKPTTTIKLTTTMKKNDFLPKNPGYDVNGISVTSLNEVTSSEDHNLSGSEQSQSDNATPVTREPGIMAAIIAGAVVGLFVSILLAMFLVYRMRKKDEGSYPLDEPCKNNYTYTKAPDKEFYA